MFTRHRQSPNTSQPLTPPHPCPPPQGPDNYPRKVEMVDNGDGTYTGRYTPDDCGQYKVHVKYGGKEVAGSPVPVQACATGHVSVQVSRANGGGGGRVRFGMFCELGQTRAAKTKKKRYSVRADSNYF